MTEEERANADATVAVCKCGSNVIIAVTAFIETDKDTKQRFLEAMIEGYDIKHFPVKDVRAMPFGCKCPKPTETIDMFTEARHA